MSTVREASYDLFRARGMNTFFGNPGSNELPFLEDFPDDFRYVLGLQEGAALGIADGYSQITRRPTLVSLHSAAGVGQAMGALVNASLNGTPLVLMSGQQFRPLVTMQGMLTNRDATTLPQPLVKWSFEPPTPAAVPAALARAVHCATTAPAGPVYVSVPLSDWNEEADGENQEFTVKRSVAGQPVASEGALASLAARLESARNPVLVLGPDVDVFGGWDAGVELAEKLSLPVIFGNTEAPRISFPTDHACYQGTLSTHVGEVRDQLAPHDLIVWIGGPVLAYHAWDAGPYLAPGCELVQVTADPDQAARAPVGESVVGDPAAALATLVQLVKPSDRPLPTPYQPAELSTSDTGTLTEDQVKQVVARTRPEDAAFAYEAPSLTSWWEHIPVNRPDSYFYGGASALGFGLPAAVGIALGAPDRRVICLLGDGSTQYSVTGLWTAAQQQTDVTFLVIRNSTYQVLIDYGTWLNAPGLPGMRLPGIDHVALAHGYGVPASQVDTADALTAALRESFNTPGPTLIEAVVPAAPSGFF